MIPVVVKLAKELVPDSDLSSDDIFIGMLCVLEGLCLGYIEGSYRTQYTALLRTCVERVVST